MGARVELKAEEAVSTREAKAAAAAPAREAVPAAEAASADRSERTKRLLMIGQARLDVGAADDPLEEEADEVARSVVARLRGVGAESAADPTGHGAGGSGSFAVRQVRRQADIGAEGGTLTSETEAAIQSARGGRALPAAMRTAMEGAFGADFSGVRVHTGPAAEDLNAGMSATAFTVGNDIFFRNGLPDASSASGQELMAHELTHTIQQGASRSIARDTKIRRHDGDHPAGAAPQPAAAPVAVVAPEPAADPAVVAESTVEDVERMLKGSELDWAKTKDKFGQNKPLITQIVAMRKAAVDGVIADMQKGAPFESLTTRPMGSGAFNSTYELILMGPGAGGAVTVFNDRFRAIWNGEARAVFDAEVVEADQTVEEVVQMLKTSELDWVSTKKEYIKNVPLMKQIVAMRKAAVDGLIADMQTKDPFKSLTTRITGSDALSSDYDITFMGPAGAEAVQEFNARFRATWNREAGTVFDTNVYAEDVLPAKQVVLAGADDLTKLGLTSEEANVDARLDEGIQDIASLVKVRKNMSQEDWDKFTTKILNTLNKSASRLATSEAAARFAEANSAYLTTYVGGLIQKLQADKDGSGLETLKAQRKAGKTDVEIVEFVMASDAGIAASNRVYEEKLQAAADCEQRRDNMLALIKARPVPDPAVPRTEAELKAEAAQKKEDRLAWTSLTADLRRAKGEAMLFANEPYFAAGTLYHVVGNVQQGAGFDVSEQALFQSFQENYGDTLKELHHLKDEPWTVVAIKSSKYVYRMLDAAVGMKETFSIDITEDVAGLRLIAKQALDNRQGAAGAPTAEQVEAQLKGVGITDKAGLKARLDKLMTEITLLMRSIG